MENKRKMRGTPHGSQRKTMEDTEDIARKAKGKLKEKQRSTKGKPWKNKAT